MTDHDVVVATPPTSNDDDDGRLDQSVAEELVERARAEGVDLVGPGGFLGDLTKQTDDEAIDDTSLLSPPTASRNDIDRSYRHRWTATGQLWSAHISTQNPDLPRGPRAAPRPKQRTRYSRRRPGDRGSFARTRP